MGLFHPDTDTVIVQIDNISIPIAAKSFQQKGDGCYIYVDSDRGVRMKLNFNRNKWSICINKGCNSEAITHQDGIDISLLIGNAEGTQNIKVKYKNQFNWRPE